MAVLTVGLAMAGCGGAQPAAAPGPACAAGQAGQAPVPLSVEQTRNAVVIAAVEQRLGVPHHAVTVALATAMQESGLRNLPYGDRDSLGLFQQRPSQGWGPSAVVLTPRLAAASFYRRLVRVPHWATLPVTQAAQAVQHSALPKAYGQQEPQARVLARALTGEVPAGLACSAPPPHAASPAVQVRALADRELGSGGLTPRTPAGQWAAGAWLVGHAADLGLTRVEVRGRRWTSSAGTWQTGPQPSSGLYFA